MQESSTQNGEKNGQNDRPRGYVGPLDRLAEPLKKLGKRILNPPPMVPVVRLSGVIGHLGPYRNGLSLKGLEDVLERAFSLSRAQAVALQVNSPGGSPVQSALIAKRIRDLAAEKELEVFAFVEDVAASGGYWLACAADRIYAQEASVVGSIGVVSSGFGLDEFIERHGIKRRMYTAGERKAMLDPFLPEDTEDVKRLKAFQEEVHESFREMVKERRGDALNAEEKEVFSGDFWPGTKAVEMGLVDELGEMREVLRKEFGEEIAMPEIEVPRGLLARLRRGNIAGEQAQAWIQTGMETLEARALWQRYGL